MKHQVLSATLLALALGASAPALTLPTCSPKEVGVAVKLDHPAFLDDFIQAINKKDETALLMVITDHFTNAVPPQERVQRILGLAEDGAPFTFDGEGTKDAESLTLYYKNRDGMRISFKYLLTADGKVDRIQARPADAVDGPPPRDYSHYTNLAGLAHDVMADAKCPAIGIAVIQDGKASVVVDGVREAGKPEKVTPDEPWSIGSIGKPVCSTIIGLLVEQGKLRWDETLAEALPDLAAGTPYADVTLEQLMRHRGGVPMDPGMNRETAERIKKGASTPSELRLNYAKDILSRKPIAKPGERMAYSNAGYALLSVVIERATGQPYEDAVRERIFKPLGMAHSYIGAATWPKDRPMGHMPSPDGRLEPVEMSGALESFFAGAGGGQYYSVGDLAKFGEAHLEGLEGKDGFMKAETVQHLHSIPKGQTGETYACGWGVGFTEIPGLPPFHEHNGSNGTFRSELAIFPDRKLVVVAIVNAGGESEPSPGLQAAVAVAKRLAP